MFVNRFFHSTIKQTSLYLGEGAFISCGAGLFAVNPVIETNLKMDFYNREFNGGLSYGTVFGGTTTWGWQLNFHTGGLNWTIRSTTTAYATGRTWYNPRVWTKWKGVYDNDKLILYVNDELRLQTVSIGAITIQNPYNTYIGSDPTGARALYGAISETKYWDGNTLIFHYKFNEGSGSTVYDHSGNNRHGTITNGVWIEE